MLHGDKGPVGVAVGVDKIVLTLLEELGHCAVRRLQLDADGSPPRPVEEYNERVLVDVVLTVIVWVLVLIVHQYLERCVHDNVFYILDGALVIVDLEVCRQWLVLVDCATMKSMNSDE